MTQQMDTLIKGNVVLSDRVIENGAVGISAGIISHIFTADQIPTADNVLDYSGKIIFPGLVDSHVHCYSNPSEGLTQATASAAAGGVTTIIEMPYDKPKAINTPELFKNKITMVEEKAHVDVALLATLSKTAKPEEIAPIIALGACGIKMSLFETDPERFPRIEDEVLWDLFPELARLHVVTGFHAENDRIIEHLIAKSIDAGQTDAPYHCITRPVISESLAILKLLEFNYACNFPLHLHHVSHPRCFELLRWYRAQGLNNISAETCPHYLALCQEDMEEVGAFGKINPPLRPKKDVAELWECVKRGEVDMIGSDHAPWTLEQKNHGSKNNIFKSASGAPGLESFFPIMYTEGVLKHGLTLPHLAQLLAENAAKRFGIGHRKGRIAVGLDADFAIIDPQISWEFDASQSLSSAKWSPYQGRTVSGQITSTILRGNVIYTNKTLCNNPGDGNFIARA